MADDQLDIQTLLQQLMPQQQQAAAPVPERSITSLLGGALGGGVDQLAPEDRETAGGRALMNFGINMLAQSGYRPRSQQVTFGEALAHGLSGAQRAVTDSEMVSSARRADRREELTKAQELRLATLKEAIPLLKLQQEQRSLDALKGGGSTAGGTGTPSLGAVTGPVAPGGAAAPIEADAQTRALAVRDGLLKRGMDFNTATAFAANALHESAADPNTGAGDKGSSHGLFQWRDDRRAAYEKKYGHAPDKAPLDEQLDFVMHELNGSESLAKGRIAAAQTAEEKAAEVSLAYLRPKDSGPEMQRRAATARQLAGLPPPAPQAGGGVAARNPGSVAVAGPGVPSGGATAAPAAAPVQAPGTPAAPAAEYTQEGVPIAPAGAVPGAAPAVPPAGPAALPPPRLPPRAPFEFRMPELTPEEARRLSPNLTPAEEADLQQQLQGARDPAQALAVRAKATEMRAKRADDAGKALADLRAKQQEEHNKQQDALQTEASKAHYEVLKEQRAAAQKAGETAEAHRLAVEMARVQGEEARRTEDAKSNNAYVVDQRKKFGEQREGARTAIDDLTMLDSLSEHAGTATPLENIVLPNGKTARDYLASLGLGSEAQQKKWGAQQAYEGALNKTILKLREGISMGALSDRDLSFLEKMAPNLSQNPETRKAITAYLLQSQHRKRQYIDTVERLWDGGDGVDKNGRKISWAKALKIAEDELPDIVPAVPAEYAGWDDKAKEQWFVDRKIRPGALVRGANGRLGRYTPGVPGEQ